MLTLWFYVAASIYGGELRGSAGRSPAASGATADEVEDGGDWAACSARGDCV